MAAAAAAAIKVPLPSFVLGSRQAGSAALPVWLVLRQLGIPFEEAPFRPLPVAGRLPFMVEPPQDQVPLLHAGRLLVWGALPILEHLAERHAGVWPADRAARAAVREVAAEAANGFPRLQALAAGEAAGRRPQPREIGRLTEELRRLQRLVDRHRHQAAGGGPFLFGTFSGADALLAPLLGRVLRQALAADPVVTGYFRALAALPACQAWLAEADQPEEAAAPVATPTHLIAPEAAEQAQEQAEPQPAPPVEEPPAPTPPVEEPPPAGEPPAPPPPPRLEDVDRPPIAYLEEPPVLGWRRLPFLERIAPLPLAPPSLPPLPRRTPPAGSTVPPVPPPAAAPPRPVPPARPIRQTPAPARPPAEPPAAERARPEGARPEGTGPADEGEDPFLFRLRRPGTVGEPGSRPQNRFARVLGTGRQRDPQPPDDEPEPPGGDRPAAIKPIGFSTQRRR